MDTDQHSTIRSFQFTAPEEALADLRRRITATRWPDGETVNDASQGVQLATMQELTRHWGTDYDWRKVEARLSALPQFVTEIDGLDIHFIHVRSKHENALPMIVTHGWPGSIIEQLKIIEPLTNPTAHGGSASDAFDLVIPSLPGYGFSGKPTAPGWTPDRIARAWATLMQRLGYTRYVAQGGDWGNAVSEVMALQQPPGLLGIHTNMPATVPTNISKAVAFHEAPAANLSVDERNAFDQLVDFYGKGLGYALEMSNRPQTLYGIVDSPVGLAAWMIDHDIRSYLMIARAFSGKTEGLSPDDVLDNVTLYWLTNTAISSARLYWDTTQVSTGGGFFDVRGVKIPVAVSVFPDEIYAAPRTWAEGAYPKLIHYGKLDRGGHFAAWEQPQLFVEEMRVSFKSLRQPT
jgi:pimeloyl-ACP methyl ester carboxylesterase